MRHGIRIRVALKLYPKLAKGWGRPKWRHVECMNCGVEGPRGRTIKAALALWNKAPRPVNPFADAIKALDVKMVNHVTTGILAALKVKP